MTGEPTRIPPHRRYRWLRRVLCLRGHVWSNWWLAPPDRAQVVPRFDRAMRRCWRCGAEEFKSW